MTVVDVHAHTFNGDDLPLKGFVQRVLMHNVGALNLVSWVLEQVGQDGTPGYESERAQLDRLLGVSDSNLPAMAFVTGPALEDQVQELYDKAGREDPRLLIDAERDMASLQLGRPPEPEALSVTGDLDAAKRAIAWALLFRRPRLDITRLLVSTYTKVDLFVPMTVDMAVGLHEAPKVTLLQQADLHEKISRLSMLGRLQEGSSAQIHPFMGFDPRSELRSLQAGDPISAFMSLQVAITDYGFIGVKLYPPMGFARSRTWPAQR